MTVFKFLIQLHLSPRQIFSELKTNKRQRNLMIIVLISMLTLIPSYVFMIVNLSNFFDLISNIDLGSGLVIQQGSLFIAIGILFSFVLIFVFGIYHIISNFFFSDEVKILITKPIKVSHLLLSKFSLVYVYQLLISIFTVLPFFVIYGVKSNLMIFQWIYLMISFLLLPIIPLVLIMILSVLIMNYTHAFKRKDLLRIIGMFLIVGVAIGFQLVINRFMFTMSEDPLEQQQQLENLLKNNHFLTERIGAIYPIILLVIRAITSSFLNASFNLFLLVIINGIGVVLLLGVMKQIYLKSYLQEQEGSNRKKLKMKRNADTDSISGSIAKVDFFTLLRVPVYLFNCLGTIVIVPLLLFITPLVTGDVGVGQLLGFYKTFRVEFWLLVLLFLVITTTLNAIASTSFSREGKTNWIMRTLPIPPRDHILGRASTPFYSQLAFSVLTVSLILFMLKQDYILASIILIISLLGTIPLILSGILIDLNRPIFNWDNPERAVKQNLNVLVSMGLGLLYGALCFTLYFLLQPVIKNLDQIKGFSLLVGLFIIFNGVLARLLYKILLNQFERKLIEME